MNDGVAGFLVIMAFLGYVLRDMKKAKQRLGWPSKNCQIVHSATKYEHEGGADGGPIKVPDIHYRYSVNGVEHEGKRVSFGSWGGTADSVARRYQRGNTVTVYYNPAKPKESMLYRDSRDPTWEKLSIVFLLFLALMFLLFG